MEIYLPPRFQYNINEYPVDGAGGLEQSIQSTTGTPLGAASTATTMGQLAVQDTSWFSDQVLPFDVTLAAANEYGALAIMRIYGCEILNEGYGVSIDDIVSEQQMSYVARTLMPWTSVSRDTTPATE